MIEISATSFCSEMKSLSSGGPTLRIACGIDDVAHRLPLGQPDGERRVALARVDRPQARPGRPRRRRRRRRASGRCAPSTTGSVGSQQARCLASELASAGIAEADQVDEQDHRDAAEDVGVDDREQPQREQRRQPSSIRTSATTRPRIRTTISTTMKMRMSSQKPSATSGKDSLKTVALKNVSRTSGQPLLVRISAGEAADDDDRRDRRDRQPAPVAAALGRRALGSPVGLRRVRLHQLRFSRAATAAP